MNTNAKRLVDLREHVAPDYEGRDAACRALLVELKRTARSALCGAEGTDGGYLRIAVQGPNGRAEVEIYTLEGKLFTRLPRSESAAELVGMSGLIYDPSARAYVCTERGLTPGAIVEAAVYDILQKQISDQQARRR